MAVGSGNHKEHSFPEAITYDWSCGNWTKEVKKSVKYSRWVGTKHQYNTQSMPIVKLYLHYQGFSGLFWGPVTGPYNPDSANINIKSIDVFPIFNYLFPIICS